MGLSESRTLHPGGSARLSLAFVIAVLAVGAMTLGSAEAASAHTHANVRLVKVHTRVPGRRARERAALRRVVRGLRRGTPRARAAIIGGREINIEQAPWHVEVLSLVVTEEVVIEGTRYKVVEEILECGGSIISESGVSASSARVVTAGHCLYNPKTLEPIPAEDVVVLAGVSNFELEEPEQVLEGERVRVHPGYVPAAALPSPDDIGVVELTTPIAFSSKAKPIALPAPGLFLQEGTSLSLTGGGREEAGVQPSGALNTFTTPLTFCNTYSGIYDAVLLCTETAGGTLCSGDSGSGLVLPGETPVLVGVADTSGVRDGECFDGAYNGYVNVTAPEIRDFIEGIDDLPVAPRGNPLIGIRAVPEVGFSATCESGGWSNGATLTYSFIDTANSQVLQEGSSSTYALTEADIGRTIECVVFASNAGGTGVGRSGVLQPIAGLDVVKPPKPVVKVEEEHKSHEPKAKSAVRITATKLSVSKGNAIVNLDCAGAATCQGNLTLTTTKTEKVKGKRRKVTVTIGAGSFSIAGGASARVKVKLSSYARGQLKHGHLHANLSILGIETEPTHARVDAVTLQ